MIRVNINIKISVILAFLSFSNVAISQKEIGNIKPEVKVKALATEGSVYLRWGVTTPTAWQYANKYGYVIERKTIVKNKEAVTNSEFIRLNTTPLKPKPMMEWEKFTEENSNAALAAQALYGEDLDINLNEGDNGIVSIINQAQVFEQRFTFALFAADQDFEVAKFSGLGFIDNTVKEGERYLYNVKVMVPPSEKISIAKGGVFLGLMDAKPLPVPIDFTGIFKDKYVLLSWNYKLLKRHYNSYIIERSNDDGKTFKRLSDLPIVNLAEKEEKPSERMFFIDSIAQNNKTYSYRIKGISSFGINGPHSELISGEGVQSLIHTPYITDLKFTSNKVALLIWDFPKEALATLSHFQIIRSDKVKNGYTIVKDNIDKNERRITLENLQPINYYKVIAIGIDKSERESFPKMVQPDDNTPPEVPTNLLGRVDSLGVVRLNWKQNTESDFLGYRIFKSNLKDDEFVQITFEPTAKNSITDTINIKTLNKKIYYKIQAFDKRYNPSSFSEILELKRPDIVPPTQPVFTDFFVSATKVKLTWETSKSEDAKVTLIYKKELGSTEDWKLLAEVPLPQNTFNDTANAYGKSYIYTLLTVDTSGLESKPTQPLQVSIVEAELKPSITKFSGLVNREERYIALAWKYNVENVKEYILYKAEEAQALTMYKVLANTAKKFIDKKLSPNTKYRYMLQAIFNSGAKSPLIDTELTY